MNAVNRVRSSFIPEKSDKKEKESFKEKQRASKRERIWLDPLGQRIV